MFEEKRKRIFKASMEGAARKIRPSDGGGGKNTWERGRDKALALSGTTFYTMKKEKYIVVFIELFWYGREREGDKGNPSNQTPSEQRDASIIYESSATGLQSGPQLLEKNGKVHLKEGGGVGEKRTEDLKKNKKKKKKKKKKTNPHAK